jgi:predicted regulator of Ras-like GTPase activity (Roadblock/LC7/MglB family)
MRDGVVIHEEDAPKLQIALARFLEDSAATEALLIERSGQLLASGGRPQTLDTVSISALAAGAFSSTGAMAKLLGENEFSVLFHQGERESLHVSTVDQHTILLAVFDDRTTVGMVRLFAKDAARAIEAILAESRTRPRLVGALASPPASDEPGQGVQGS